MSENPIGEYERKDIDNQISRVLRDLGDPEPPLNLDDVRALLKLDRQYYSSSDPSFVAELAHHVRLSAKKLGELGTHLLKAIAKAKFQAFWHPDNRRILIDSEVPKLKHRWIEAHEIGHSITPWHTSYLLGDSQYSLDPLCRATIEAEANFAADRLLFLRDQFVVEARDLSPTLRTVSDLSKRYGNTLTSTLWNFAERRDPDRPVFAMVSCHPKHDGIGTHDGPDPWRYFIRSNRFRHEFGNVTADMAFDLLRRHANWKQRGPIVDIVDSLVDRNGSARPFRIESLATQRGVYTLATAEMIGAANTRKQRR